MNKNTIREFVPAVANLATFGIILILADRWDTWPKEPTAQTMFLALVTGLGAMKAGDIAGIVTKFLLRYRLRGVSVTLGHIEGE